MIRHAALFRLDHAAGSADERAFFRALAALESIPGVTRFQVAREVSPKNQFDYAVSMSFADEAAYQAYNDHPTHVEFVLNHWVTGVSEFMEHDTVPLE